ncbi:hypothetical protein G6F22_016106 [Rhizopus arrhizus]|nr:hypothetical protein G6F22_016106 [Rhizopus arrhizus]
MGAAQQSGYVLCVHPVGGVRHQQAERGVEQGGIHALAAPGARAVVQRQQDARLRGVARQVVHDGDADAGGAAGGPAQRSVVAESRNGAVDQLRKARLEVRLVIQPPPGHRAGDEVLDQDVGVLQQAQQDVAPACQRQVQPDRPLAAVDGGEVGRVALRVDGRPQRAGLVAARRFDLDHVRALVSQHLGAQRTRQYPGQVDDPNALQRAGGPGVWGMCSMLR